MNNLNKDDEDLSARVHTFVQRLVDNGAKNEFMAGTYHCPGDNGELAKIYGFVGTTIKKSHIQMILAQIWDRPTPGHIDREASRICTQGLIATEKMRSFIFPQEIVQEMIARDHCNNRKITTIALYTCVKAVITLINRLNGSSIEEGAIEGVAAAGVCMAIINMNPIYNTKDFESSPRAP